MYNIFFYKDKKDNKKANKLMKDYIESNENE